MQINVTGIIINGIMLLLILALLIAGIVYNSDLRTCESNQSTFCYNIQCPCDDKNGPCFGFAYRPGPKEGQYYCSNAPMSLVDSSGKII